MAEMAYKRIEPHVSDYMGTVFELICRQYVYELARAGQLDVVPASVGRVVGDGVIARIRRKKST